MDHGSVNNTLGSFMIKFPTVKNKKVDTEVQESYDNLWKHEWRDLHKVGPGVRTRNRILLKYFKKYITSGSVLDAGCGDGSLLIKLHQVYQDSLEYDAGDISEEVLQIIRAQPFIGEIFLLDLEKSSTIPSKTYTAVICSEVLEHLKDWQLAVGYISTLLEKDGFLFITVPAQMKYWGPHDEFALHYRRFEIDEIENHLRQNGYQIKESKYWGWPFYWLYYTLILNRTPPKIVMREVTSPIKRFAANIFFSLFLIDDLFSTRWGRRLFLVAKKMH
jgi:SAM-dependent methyltransferase